MRADHFLLAEHDWVPNNPRLPVIVYRRAVTASEDMAATFETLFGSNGWPAQWRDSVYDYHHYHSTAHEALGVFAGSARLMIGGPGGRKIAVEAGDALTLPTGTGHCLIEADADFQIVGAYPAGQDWDVCRSAPDAAARERMMLLPVPARDPVGGAQGPLTWLWQLG